MSGAAQIMPMPAAASPCPANGLDLKGKGGAGVIAGRNVWRFFADWRGGKRLAFAILIAFNVFDLSMTMSLLGRPGFAEANPLMAYLNAAGMLTFKVAAVAVGSCILLVLWKHRLARLACWGMCGVYAAVMLLWSVYFLAGTCILL